MRYKDFFKEKPQLTKISEGIKIMSPEEFANSVDEQDDTEVVDENLRKWFKEKWVRFNPQGKIMGPCARGDDSEGKPKCLPQSKAHSLGKKGRASAAARKRREDPNPERSGKAINVATKKKSNEGVAEGGAETSWSDENEKITLQDILELTKHIKQINLPINDNLKSKLIHWDGNPEEIERINQVTVSNQFPILVMVDEQGQIDWILDGNHRLHKAIKSQAKTIPAKLIRLSDLNDKAKRIFHINEQGVAEGQVVEIDYSDHLDSSNYPQNKIIQMSHVDGQIEGHDVYTVSSGNQKVYFLKDGERISALVGFQNGNLKNIKNFTGSAGVIRALVGYIVHIKRMPIKILSKEPLTRDGLKWVIGLINSPRGLKITDQEGNQVDIELLKKEWISARSTGISGNTEIIISENVDFGNKLRINESQRKSKSILMPHNFYHVSKKNIVEDQLDELKCWPGYSRVKGVPQGAPGSCKKKSKKTAETVQRQTCPECGGPAYEDEMLAEKKDACYHKVKSRYKVWPSAYASGALVKCRKVGAKNWGTKSESIDEATKLAAPTRKIADPELTDYLDRIRKQEKKKTDKYKMPYIHRKDVVGYYNEEGQKYNIDSIKKALATRPKSLLKKNEKMKHSDGAEEQFFNIGFAALTGIALDEEDNDLIIVNTCPGAGSCKIDCFAMKGGKIQFQGPWLSDGRILTYLLNDPDGFFNQLKAEISTEVAKGNKKKYKVSIRWHDAGDFFSPEYVDLAFKLAREFPNVDFYAYTKIADVALGNKPENFMINWSEGAHPSQEKKIKGKDPELVTTKNSRIVPSNLFYDLLVKDEKKNLVKGPAGQWQVIPEKIPELKQRLADEYNLSKHSILTYTEWESKVKGKEDTPLKYNVIITPGEPDLTAKDPGVLSTLLLKH